MDIEYLLWLQKLREAAGPVLEYVFYGLTMLAVAGIAVAMVIYYCGDKEKGYHVIASFMVGNLCAQFLKNIFCINRPWIRDSRVEPSRLGISGATGYSFPSGHSNSAASTYGSIAKQYKKKKLTVFLVILILLIGFSRNYLGVHTPQDVAVGLLVGTGSVFGVDWFLCWYRKKDRNDWLFVILAFILCGVLCLFTVTKSYPMTYEDGQLVVDPLKMQRDALQGYGMFGGFVLGSVLEKKYVGFTTEHLTRKTKVFRIVICALLVGIIYFFFHNSMQNVIEDRIRYLLMGFLMMFAAVYLGPMVFKERERHSS